MNNTRMKLPACCRGVAFTLIELLVVISVIASFGGQAYFMPYDAFQREQSNNKPGLLWCVPDSPTGQ
jgi:prepilin-type N-terminal cleavage/methylation domain-containing protein